MRISNDLIIKIIFAISLLPYFGYAQSNRLNRKEHFSDFLKNLEYVCQNRDLNTFSALLYDTILESSDICGYPGCTKEEFLKYYFREDESKDWQLLYEILQVGFSEVPPDSGVVRFKEITKIFEASFYMRQINWSESLMILENSIIRRMPSPKAGIIEKALKGNVFSCNCCVYDQEEGDITIDSEGAYWIKIKLKNESFGFVELSKTSQKYFKILEIALIKDAWKIIAWYTREPC